jgi:hypothetical protein
VCIILNYGKKLIGLLCFYGLKVRYFIDLRILISGPLKSHFMIQHDCFHDEWKKPMFCNTILL